MIVFPFDDELTKNLDGLKHPPLVPPNKHPMVPTSLPMPMPHPAMSKEDYAEVIKRLKGADVEEYKKKRAELVEQAKKISETTVTDKKEGASLAQIDQILQKIGGVDAIQQARVAEHDKGVRKQHEELVLRRKPSGIKPEIKLIQGYRFYVPLNSEHLLGMDGVQVANAPSMYHAPNNAQTLGKKLGLVTSRLEDHICKADYDRGTQIITSRTVVLGCAFSTVLEGAYTYLCACEDFDICTDFELEKELWPHYIIQVKRHTDPVAGKISLNFDRWLKHEFHG